MYKYYNYKSKLTSAITAHRQRLAELQIFLTGDLYFFLKKRKYKHIYSIYYYII